jgi:uncharacterized protein (DUF433 family)
MSQPLIISAPEIMMSKPIIAGTRVTVALILEKLAAGETIEQILEAHPRLSREAIREAIDFVATEVGRLGTRKTINLPVSGIRSAYSRNSLN